MERYVKVRELLLEQFGSQELVISMMVDDFESTGRELFNRTKDKLNSASTDFEFDKIVLDIIQEADTFITGVDSEADLDSLTDEETVKLIFYNSIVMNINILYTNTKEGNYALN